MVITIGVGLLVIALFAQWLITKRAKDQKTRQHLSWIAWVAALIGGTAAASDWGEAVGINSLGAGVVSVLGLLLLYVDLKDKRPDWLAFGVICVLPTFMKLTSGPVGDLFDLVLMAPGSAAQALAAGFGG